MYGIVPVEDGVMKQFLTALQTGLVLFAMAVSGAGWASDGKLVSAAIASGEMIPGEMTGAYYMRDSLVPRAGDLILIQSKPALYLASFNDDMATVAYSVDHGRLVYRVVEGEIDAAAKAEIDRALVRLQRKLV